MSYYVRNSSGESKGKISNEIANKLMHEARGFFREANYSSGKKTVFEIKDDCSFGNDHFKLMIWKGDVLEPID